MKTKNKIDLKKLRRTITFILAFVLIAGVFTSCAQNEKLNNSTTVSQNDLFNSAAEEETINRAPGSSNQISSDIIVPNKESMTLTYNGKPIEAEYEFSCQNACTMGLMIFVDGSLQPYTVDGKETTMHKVELKDNETKRFKFSFTPICGKKGDKLTVILANVYNPNVMELKGDINTFGNNHKISQPLPWKLQMNADSPERQLNISTDYKKISFTPQEKENYTSIDRDGKIHSELEGDVKIDIMNASQVINGKAELKKYSDNKMSIRVYGNSEGKYKVSLYGDFNLIPINGKDYIELEVEKDKYSVIDFTFSKEDSAKYKNIFAIAAPMDKDNSLGKSASVYIASN